MGRNLKINRDFVLFAVGAIVGSTATWLYLKDEYDRRLKEDVDSVKESFGRLYKKEEKPEEEKPYTPTKDDLATLTKTIQTNGYRDYSNSEEEEKESMNEPYVISPNDFNELGYNTKTLTYWEDGIVTDNEDNIVEDYEEHIGDDALGHFGEYEDDSVFVRNDEEQTDYDILLDGRNYHDVYGDTDD